MNEQDTFEQLTLRREVDENGTVYWYNLEGQLHRTNGPAFIEPNRREIWYRHGYLHRADGPAVRYNDGHQEWWIESVRLTEEQFDAWRKSKLV